MDRFHHAASQGKGHRLEAGRSHDTIRALVSPLTILGDQVSSAFYQCDFVSYSVNPADEQGFSWQFKFSDIQPVPEAMLHWERLRSDTAALA